MSEGLTTIQQFIKTALLAIALAVVVDVALTYFLHKASAERDVAFAAQLAVMRDQLLVMEERQRRVAKSMNVDVPQ